MAAELINSCTVPYSTVRFCIVLARRSNKQEAHRSKYRDSFARLGMVLRDAPSFLRKRR